MRKALLAAFLCGVLAGLPIVARADTVDVSANVVQPEVIMTLNPTSVSFGNLLQGQTSQQKTIDVKNGSATTPLKVDVNLINYPSSFGDPNNDPTKIGLYWTPQPWNPNLFRVGSIGANPSVYVGPNATNSLIIFMKAGANAPTGPVNFTLEFRPSPSVN